MTVLSAQSIRSMCDTMWERPLISPFVERGISNGRSYGISSCSYDARIDHELVLHPRQCALASTMERFIFPDDICGHVRDKSSLARRFVHVFNTHFDAGWEGFATIELVNFSPITVRFEKGDPICQFVFQSLDEPTVYPYRGKYFNQERGPQEARYEEAE